MTVNSGENDHDNLCTRGVADDGSRDYDDHDDDDDAGDADDDDDDDDDEDHGQDSGDCGPPHGEW